MACCLVATDGSAQLKKVCTSWHIDDSKVFEALNLWPGTEPHKMTWRHASSQTLRQQSSVCPPSCPRPELASAELRARTGRSARVRRDDVLDTAGNSLSAARGQ